MNETSFLDSKRKDYMYEITLMPLYDLPTSSVLCVHESYHKSNLHCMSQESAIQSLLTRSCGDALSEVEKGVDVDQQLS